MSATSTIDKRITEFIRKHHVMTLACADCATGAPYCCNLFYKYIPEMQCFVFTSSSSTRHAESFAHNGKVAASIVLETSVIGKIRGLQICGNVRHPTENELPQVKKAYIMRFPYAAVMDLDLWIMEPSMLKYTDNRLGFGTKLVWNSETISPR